MSQSQSKGVSPSSKGAGSSAMKHSNMVENEEENANLLAPLQLASENEKLRQQLADREEQLMKTEEKLEKKRRFIKEMQGLQQDLTLIKQSHSNKPEVQEDLSDKNMPQVPLQQARTSFKRFTNNSDTNEEQQQNMQSMSEQELKSMQVLIQKYDEMAIENRVLKAKIGEMESQVNSMSTNFRSLPRSSLAAGSANNFV